MKQPPVDLAQRLVGASDQILGAGGDVRLEDVAATVGVARTTLYYYFSGRDDLVSFLLSEHVRAGAEAIETARSGDGTPSQRLRRVLTVVVGFLGEHRGLCSGLLSSMGSAGRMDEVLEANERHVATPLRQLIIEGIDAGELRPVDPTDVTNALLGASLMTVLGRSRRDVEVTQDEADEIAGVLLGGVLAGN